MALGVLDPDTAVVGFLALLDLDIGPVRLADLGGLVVGAVFGLAVGLLRGVVFATDDDAGVVLRLVDEAVRGVVGVARLEIGVLADSGVRGLVAVVLVVEVGFLLVSA